MEIKLKAKHFKKAFFFDGTKCPISNAIKEIKLVSGAEAAVGLTSVSVTNGSPADFDNYCCRSYSLKSMYDLRKFEADEWRARSCRPNTVIRTIEVEDLEIEQILAYMDK